MIPTKKRRDWLTRAEVAEYLGLSIRTIIRWTLDGKLPGKKVGMTVRYDLDTVNALFDPARHEKKVWAKEAKRETQKRKDKKK